MIVVNRFRVDEADLAATESFRADARVALDTLATRPGYVTGQVARNVDDPGLWLVTTTWANIGSYRRALSSYDVKVGAVPLLSRAVDEPSAYESDEPGDRLNEPVPRELG